VRSSVAPERERERERGGGKACLIYLTGIIFISTALCLYAITPLIGSSRRVVTDF
jgi:hypothetical protein